MVDEDFGGFKVGFENRRFLPAARSPTPSRISLDGFPGTNNSGPMKRHQFRITVERLNTWKGIFIQACDDHGPLPLV